MTCGSHHGLWGTAVGCDVTVPCLPRMLPQTGRAAESVNDTVTTTEQVSSRADRRAEV